MPSQPRLSSRLLISYVVSLSSLPLCGKRLIRPRIRQPLAHISPDEISLMSRTTISSSSFLFLMLLPSFTRFFYYIASVTRYYYNYYYYFRAKNQPTKELKNARGRFYSMHEDAQDISNLDFA
jgi:hypothetical protein